MSNLIQKISKEKDKDKEKSIEGKLGVIKKSFRFIHDFFFFQSLPENHKKIKENKWRKIDERLELEGDGKIEISSKEQNSAYHYI